MKSLIQSEAAECGLACLAMVAGHYGLHMDLPQMRRRFPLSLKGLRLNKLIEHAQQLGLNARALRLEMQDLGRLKLPCILHWDLNHFVVLARVGSKKAVLLDPASGRREMDLQEVRATSRAWRWSLRLRRSSGRSGRRLRFRCGS